MAAFPLTGPRPLIRNAAFLIVAAVLGAAAPAKADGVISIENRTVRTVKAVVFGGSAVLEPNSQPVSVSVASAEPVGVTLQAWWTDEPLQRCRIFVTWNSAVIVSGTSTIICRSH
jgi:hypothetical protein